MNADHLTILHQIPEARWVALDSLSPIQQHWCTLSFPKGLNSLPHAVFYYPELRGFWEDHHHETLFASKGSSQNHCPVKRRLATRMSFADPFIDTNWESPSAFWCRKSLTSAASFGRHITSTAVIQEQSVIFTNTCTQVLFESTFQF